MPSTAPVPADSTKVDQAVSRELQSKYSRSPDPTRAPTPADRANDKDMTTAHPLNRFVPVGVDCDRYFETTNLLLN